MAATDRDIFIDVGISIAKLLLIASGQGAIAAAVGEGAGLLTRLRGMLENGAKRAVFAEKIADDAATQLLQEHEGISEADWHVATRQVASLIDRLSEKDRLAAGYNWEELRWTLLDLGGTDLRSSLADESAKHAFNWVLEVACRRISDCFTEKEALAALLGKIDEACARLQRIERLLDRPGVQEIRAVINDHIEVLRELAPDRLEDRESEMADLETYVRKSDDAWYAMEADMVSGKTAVMASFALNPPDDVHLVSFFIRRIGDEGNDRGTFAFVMGAQFANILGHEYTEPVRDPAQRTEFRQLLRRAATACRSETVPRPLVLLIDGIDEDSYFENPDGVGAKSILSLLPRRLPEGVKIITASRPNPRLPEDVQCVAKRRIVSLRPSPIAEKSINRKDMKTFFRSDIAVNIGAFLAACGGVLTVKDLSKLLTMCGYQRTRTWDVREYVDRSPGRILTPVNVGFDGQEVLAYRLGHDVVTRAVIRELDPDSFGEGDEPEDERWWAPIREKALAPYRAIIRDWVEECADRGWGYSTPSYVLSDPCFDLMLTDKGGDFLSVQIVLQRGRYEELLRRSGRRLYVLRTIDRDYFKVLEVRRGEVSEGVLKSLLEVAEFRGRIVRTGSHVPGLLKLYIEYFDVTPDVALDMTPPVDDANGMLNAFREVVKVVADSGRSYTFLPLLSAVIKVLIPYRDLRDDILRLGINVLASIGDVANFSNVGGDESEGLTVWLDKLFDVIQINRTVVCSVLSADGVYSADEGADSAISLLVAAEDMADQIEDPASRAQALVEVACALARVGEADKAGRVAENAANAADQIEEHWGRARALVEVACALARVGEADKAGRVAENAANAADQIEEHWGRARALVEVACALAQADLPDDAVEVAKQIRDKDAVDRAQVLAEVVGALARAGEIDAARRLADKVVGVVGRVRFPWRRAEVLVDVLARAGEVDAAQRLAENAANAAERFKSPWVRSSILVGEKLWWRVRALVGAAGALARAGDIDRACQVAMSAASATDHIQNPLKRARALVGVAGVLARAGDIDRACQVAMSAASATDHIQNPLKRARALVGVAGVLARAGDIERVRQVAMSAASATAQIENFDSRARVMVEVAGVLARSGDIDAARQVAENVVNAVEQVKESEECVGTPAGSVSLRLAPALGKIVDALVRVGETDRARQVAEIALSAIKRIAEPWRRARALGELAVALARAGDADEARQVAEIALSAIKRIAEPWRRARALGELAVALARAGQAEAAFGVAKQIGEPWRYVRALAEVAAALARAGQAEAAFGVAKQIGEPWRYVQALAEVAPAFVRAGDAGKARQVAMGAAGVAEQIEGSWLRARALAEVACALARVGEGDKARRVAENAANAAEQIEGSWLRARALAEVACALARVGEGDKARRVAENAANAAEQIEEHWGRARALAEMAGVLARADSIPEALKIMTLIEIDKSSYRSRAQSTIIEFLVRKGSFDDAIDLLRTALLGAEGFVHRQEAADYCAVLATGCLDAFDHIDVSSSMRERWLGLTRSVLARSWLYGASVWDNFDVLVGVAPELAVQLVDERILAEPEGGIPPESDPDLGPEGPGGHTGAYR